MDKLDKVPPKKIKLLRDNPIALGVLSNFIYAGLGWVAAHYALLWGIGPHWAILIGAFVFFLIALSVNLLRRRRDAQLVNPAEWQLQSTGPQLPPEEPIIEILSPFDHDEVGLYETVRGQVYPANQELQVAVFAGDRKWYPQKPVVVKGSKWSVKCKFGRRDQPDKGPYKVVALLGNELTDGMQSELPTNVPKSNVITVHRPEVTTEQELTTALSERDDFKKQLQSATNAVTDMDEQVEALTTENSKLERELVTIKKDKHSLEQSLQTIQRELADVRSGADARQDSYKLEREALLKERKLLNKEILEAQRALKEETKRADYESSQREGFITLYKESERNLGNLRWLESRMKEQGEHLDIWVRIKRVACVKLQLTETPRMIVFAFWVHNGSIFDIAFDFDHLTGRLHFKNRPFNDPVKVSPNKIIDILPPGGEFEIVIEQPLLATEAETVLTAQKIGDPNGIFWLGNLDIPISTISSPQSFNKHKLRIYSEIEIQYVKDFPCEQ